MFRRTRKWLFAGLIMTAAAPAMADVTVVDHRTKAPVAKPVAPPPVLSVFPTSAPPGPQTEAKGKARGGYVWVSGNWIWLKGAWTWNPGHYERQRAKHRWQQGKWELVGGKWTWIDNKWEPWSPYPTSAPPSSPSETAGTAPTGRFWVAGRWTWKDGDWVWSPGRYDKRKQGFRFKLGAWANVGGKWTWTADSWLAAPKLPDVTMPSPTAETGGTRAGYVWVRGYWDWAYGEWTWKPGHYERVRRGYRWKDGGWAQVGGGWTFEAPTWYAAPALPDAGMPTPQVETAGGARAGVIWVAGYWDWSYGEWAWRPGHYERVKINSRWQNGGWSLVNGVWTFTKFEWRPAPTTPDIAPPPMQPETPTARDGYQWVGGRWTWVGGAWKWMPGSLQARKARGLRWHQGSWTVSGNTWVWAGHEWRPGPTTPDTDPPSARPETPGSRGGYIWMPGHWEWQGDWVWVAGKYERAKTGHRFQAGGWQKIGGVWTWAGHGWIPAPKTPDLEPPTPRPEVSPKARAGFVWTPGRWDWKDGNWAWTPGKWQRAQKGKQWKAGAWTKGGSGWSWSADSWADLSVSIGSGGVSIGVSAGAGPRSAPPAIKVEAEATQRRAGFIWIPGHYEWKAGTYGWTVGHWEREQASKKWRAGAWTVGKDGVYVWSAGAWQ